MGAGGGPSTGTEAVVETDDIGMPTDTGSDVETGADDGGAVAVDMVAGALAVVAMPAGGVTGSVVGGTLTTAPLSSGFGS